MLRFLNFRNSLFVLVSLASGYIGLLVMLNIFYLIDQPDLGVLGRVLVYGAVFEELVKFAIVLVIFRFYKLPISAVFVGLGFGFGERLLYWGVSGTLIGLDFLALGMHIIAGLSSAHFLSKYKITSLRRDFLLAITAPILVHGTYNTVLWIWQQLVSLGV